jgi:hypothetical protein
VNAKQLWAALALAGAAPLFVAGGARAMLRRLCNGPFFSSASPAAHRAALAISRGSFANRGYIPKKFTGDGADISPELSWTNPPPGAQSFALIAEDPDAPVGTWTHWLIFDLPPTTRSLPEGVGKIMDKLPDGGRQGRNDRLRENRLSRAPVHRPANRIVTFSSSMRSTGSLTSNPDRLAPG